MVFEKYRFPCPNNGDRYDLSLEELSELLESVYQKGFKDGVASTVEPETTCVSTTNEIVIKYPNRRRRGR